MPSGIKELEKHAKDYKEDSWRNYTFQELGAFVGLLTKRATHRANSKKAEKDMYDAQNYLKMMQYKLDEINEDLAIEHGGA